MKSGVKSAVRRKSWCYLFSAEPKVGVWLDGLQPIVKKKTSARFQDQFNFLSRNLSHAAGDSFIQRMSQNCGNLSPQVLRYVHNYFNPLQLYVCSPHTEMATPITMTVPGRHWISWTLLSTQFWKPSSNGKGLADLETDNALSMQKLELRTAKRPSKLRKEVDTEEVTIHTMNIGHGHVWCPDNWPLAWYPGEHQNYMVNWWSSLFKSFLPKTIVLW